MDLQARPLLKHAMENRNFDALVDPRLQKDYNSEEMAAMVACAAACVRNSEWRRPRMSQVDSSQISTADLLLLIESFYILRQKQVRLLL